MHPVYELLNTGTMCTTVTVNEDDSMSTFSWLNSSDPFHFYLNVGLIFIINAIQNLALILYHDHSCWPCKNHLINIDYFVFTWLDTCITEIDIWWLITKYPQSLSKFHDFFYLIKQDSSKEKKFLNLWELEVFPTDYVTNTTSDN